ncbi:MAG: hypothetical protein U1E53_04785 [Dongiaceae bacterium]
MPVNRVAGAILFMAARGIASERIEPAGLSQTLAVATTASAR